MSIAIQQLSYLHPDRKPLFREIGFSLLSGQKVALIGDNGSGKSTLLQIMGGRLPAAAGEVICLRPMSFCWTNRPTTSISGVRTF